MPPTWTLNFPGSTARAIGGSCRAMTAATPARPASIRSRPRLRRLACAAPEQVADGVWLLRGGLTRTMNVYLLEEPDGPGVTVYDAGEKGMAGGLAAGPGSLRGSPPRRP